LLALLYQWFQCGGQHLGKCLQIKSTPYRLLTIRSSREFF
jgi:hypothetical protein